MGFWKVGKTIFIACVHISNSKNQIFLQWFMCRIHKILYHIIGNNNRVVISHFTKMLFASCLNAYIWLQY